MEFKGTKGKWSYETTKKGHCMIIVNDWFYFCKVYTIVDGHSDLKEVTQANAKLICAAPDLLEALQEIIIQNELRGYGDSIDTIKAKRAIEKALG